MCRVNVDHLKLWSTFMKLEPFSVKWGILRPSVHNVYGSQNEFVDSVTRVFILRMRSLGQNGPLRRDAVFAVARIIPSLAKEGLLTLWVRAVCISALYSPKSHSRWRKKMALCVTLSRPHWSVMAARDFNRRQSIFMSFHSILSNIHVATLPD